LTLFWGEHPAANRFVGGTLADGRAFICQFPLISFFEALIFLTVLAFIGDGFDPR
jgi:hypothetical protein